MMGEFVKMETRPKCCQCSRPATGRVCYMGAKNKVVDNPFCNMDFTEIYKETENLLDEEFGLSIEGDWVYIQRWKYTEDVPPMPFNYGDLIGKGKKRR